jgi:hypothetical protein
MKKRFKIIANLLIAVMLIAPSCAAFARYSGEHSHNQTLLDASSTHHANSLACCDDHNEESQWIAPNQAPFEIQKNYAPVTSSHFLWEIGQAKDTFTTWLDPPDDLHILRSVIRRE